MKQKRGKSNGTDKNLSEKDKIRIRLKAKIEANRISRLKREDQDQILKEYKEKKKKATGIEKERLKVFIEVIKDKQRQNDEAYDNMSYAEYGGGFENGGGGSGCDAG